MASSVILYETEISVLLSLPEEQRGRILTAILCDTAGKELPEMDASDNAIFTLVNAQVKRAAELSSKRKQSAKSRWQNQSDNGSDNEQEEQSGTVSVQKSNTDMQNSANGMQNDTVDKTCTDLHNANECTITTTITTTNTNTITDTNTITKTETNTETEAALAPASPNESKPKKSKKAVTDKKQYADFVTLTDEEYSKLVSQYGEQAVRWCIQKLDNYKGSTGRKYANDYKTILSWVINSYNEEQAKHNKPVAQSRAPGAFNTGNPFLNMLRDLEEQEAKEIVVQGNITDNGDT